MQETSAKSLLMEHREKERNAKYGCFPALLNTWTGWIAAAIRPKNPYAEKLLIFHSGRKFLFTGKRCPPNIGQSNYQHCGAGIRGIL